MTWKLAEERINSGIEHLSNQQPTADKLTTLHIKSLLETTCQLLTFIDI